MSRTAHCVCGALRVEVDGDPGAVVACHCEDCQRRTGAPFGVGAYYAKSQARISGPSTAYTRVADSGRKFTSYFCPTCGTSVYWEAENHPDGVGIAVGAFFDPAFHAPGRSVWERSRHPWIDFDAEMQHFPRGRDSSAAKT